MKIADHIVPRCTSLVAKTDCEIMINKIRCSGGFWVDKACDGIVPVAKPRSWHVHLYITANSIDVEPSPA